MHPLRNYQKQVVRDTYGLIFQNILRILIFAPTGAGKTIIATKIVSDIVSRAKKVLFVVHREILVSQTFNKFSAANLECGFIKAGWQENYSAPVQIASVQTLPKREDWKRLNFDVIIFDECHLVAFATICQQMMKSIFPNVIYLGLTATPWRLSKKESLGDIYSGLVCAPMPKDLIEAEYLVKPSYYALESDVTLDDVEPIDGDYNRTQLSPLCNRPELIEQLCNSWFELAYNRATIVFAVNVAHARNIATAFNEHGITAEIVSGSTPIKKRSQLYRQLANGELKAIVSCDALSEGFDVPRVSCVILARPTQSKALYFQQIGRGLRPDKKNDKRDCIVLDQSGNVLKHGFVEDLDKIELIPSVAKSTESSPPPLKVCPQDNSGCGKYIYSFYLKCPHCQYNFDLQKLVTVLGNSRAFATGDEIKFDYYRSLLRDAYKQNFAPSWAAVKFKDKYGFFPPYDWARGAIFHHQKSSISKYRVYLERIAQRLDKEINWVEKYLSLEFGKI